MADLKLADSGSVEPRDVKVDGAEHVTIRWLISKKDGAPRFQMRLFEVGPGGSTPFHAHDWEHEVYILSGEGKLLFEEEEKPFSEGFFIFVPEGRDHSFVNTGDVPMKFLCMIPA